MPEIVVDRRIVGSNAFIQVTSVVRKFESKGQKANCR